MTTEIQNNKIFPGISKNINQLLMWLGKRTKSSRTENQKSLGKRPSNWMNIVKQSVVLFPHSLSVGWYRNWEEVCTLCFGGILKTLIWHKVFQRTWSKYLQGCEERLSHIKTSSVKFQEKDVTIICPVKEGKKQWGALPEIFRFELRFMFKRFSHVDALLLMLILSLMRMLRECSC